MVENIMPKLKNPKHELLAKNIIKEKFNLTKAYQETYPTAKYETANSNVHSIVKRSEVISRVEELANNQGLTLEYELKKLQDIHSATKPISHNKQLIDYPDYSTQLEAVKVGLKIHGVLGGEAQVNDNRQIHFNISQDSIEMLNNTLKELSALEDKKVSKLGRALDT